MYLRVKQNKDETAETPKKPKIGKSNSQGLPETWHIGWRQYKARLHRSYISPLTRLPALTASQRGSIGRNKIFTSAYHISIAIGLDGSYFPAGIAVEKN